MIIAVDFDGVVVRPQAFADVATPLRFQTGAAEALRSLKAAGHVLLLYSARTNRALLFTPSHDPLVRAGVRRVDRKRWERERPLHWARLRQMETFIERNLKGVFAAIDDGLQGKPVADLYIDDRALRFGAGADAAGWTTIQDRYGARPSPLRGVA